MKINLQLIILIACFGIVLCGRRRNVSQRHKVSSERYKSPSATNLNRRYIRNGAPKLGKIQIKKNVPISRLNSTEDVRYECKSVVRCFQLGLLHNLSEISRSGDVNLTRSLFLEKVGGKIAVPKTNLTVQEVERRLSQGSEEENGYLRRVLAEKTLEVLESHILRWHVQPGLDFRVYKVGGHLDVSVEYQELDEDGRTFGIGPRKRLMMALLPMMYKMGVMTTMLGALIVLALKGLAIGVILLVLSVGNVFAKLKMGHGGGGWHDDYYHHHHGPRPIHVHVHTGGEDKQAYSSWHSASGPGYPAQYHHDRLYQAMPGAQYSDSFR